MTGKQKFHLLWGGELVSIIGSGITAFALGIFVLEKTESATAYAMTLLFAILPGVLVRPLAGVLADKWDRRKILIFSDLGASLGTVYIALIYFFGDLTLLHICIGTAVNSIFNGFQNAAYQASVTQLVPREFYDRAGGMVQAAMAGGVVVSPLLAPVLLDNLGLEGIFVIDFVTFFCAFVPLLFMKFPPVAAAADTSSGKDIIIEEKSVFSDFIEGVRYLKKKAGLTGVFAVLGISNFFRGMFIALIAPMILGFTTTGVLGIGQAISAVGMIVGSIYMSVKGVPKKYMKVLFIALFLSGVSYALLGLKADAVAVIIPAFLFFLSLPFINTIADTVIRRKVDIHMQGRMYSVSQIFAQLASALAIIIAGPLADLVFNPMLMQDGTLAGAVGSVIGSGPGRGIAFMFIIMGGALVVFAGIFALFPGIRKIDSRLPDIVVETEADEPLKELVG